MSHLSCCIEGNVLGIMEEPHVEDSHEGGVYLQLLVKIWAKHSLRLRGMMKYSSPSEIWLITFNMDQQIKFLVHPFIGWIEAPWEVKNFIFAINFLF